MRASYTKLGRDTVHRAETLLELNQPEDILLSTGEPSPEMADFTMQCNSRVLRRGCIRGTLLGKILNLCIRTGHLPDTSPSNKGDLQTYCSSPTNKPWNTANGTNSFALAIRLERTTTSLVKTRLVRALAQAIAPHIVVSKDAMLLLYRHRVSKRRHAAEYLAVHHLNLTHSSMASFLTLRCAVSGQLAILGYCPVVAGASAVSRLLDVEGRHIAMTQPGMASSKS